MSTPAQNENRPGSAGRFPEAIGGETDNRKDSGPERPETVPVDPEAIPADLKALDRWVGWRWQYRPDQSKPWTKPPYQVNGRKAKSTDPQTWTSFEKALAAYEDGRFDGIGFVVTDDDDLAGVDLDHCVEDGTIAEWARDVVDRLGSYTEVSPSGTGARIILRGKLPAGRRKAGDMEMYESGRYLTITGHRLTDSGIEHRQDQLEDEHARWFPTVPNGTPDEVAPGSHLPDPRLSDLEVLELARNAANGSKFQRYYNGSNEGTDDGTPSAGDLAMLCQLAFYTRDRDQLDRLFRGSPRMRSKWDRKTGNSTYGAITIDKALASVTETYTPSGYNVVPIRLPDGTIRWEGGTGENSPVGASVEPGEGDGGTLADLMVENIEAIRFVIEGLVPEGLTILAGKPKLGKSWLALLLALAICAGQSALGHATTVAEVLYIALEDGKRRLQDRVRILGGHKLGDALGRFHYRTRWPLLVRDGIQALEQWMTDHPNTRLIVIDTYGKVRGPLAGKDRYQEEYELVGRLQSFATRHRVAIILVHHLRKQAADDWLEQMSGSQALTGAADTLLGLFRERGQMDATLRLVSREVDEKDLALRFESGRWESMGDAAMYRQSVERTAVLQALDDLGEGSASDIAPLVDKTPANVSKMLVGLHKEGLITRERRGVYSLSTPVDQVDSVDTQPPESTQSTQSTQVVDQGKSFQVCVRCGEPGGLDNGDGRLLHADCALEQARQPAPKNLCYECSHPIPGAHRPACPTLPDPA